jgi:hypothetical protein
MWPPKSRDHRARKLPTKCTLCYSGRCCIAASVTRSHLPTDSIGLKTGIWRDIRCVQAVENVLCGSLRCSIRARSIREVSARCASVLNRRETAAAAKRGTKGGVRCERPISSALAFRMSDVRSSKVHVADENPHTLDCTSVGKRMLKSVVFVEKIELHKLEFSRCAGNGHLATVAKIRFNDDDILHKRTIWAVNFKVKAISINNKLIRVIPRPSVETPSFITILSTAPFFLEHH